MNNGWKAFGYGLAAAVISGAGGTALNGLMGKLMGAPFTWGQLGAASLTTGLAAAIGYLRQSPLPGDSGNSVLGSTINRPPQP